MHRFLCRGCAWLAVTVGFSGQALAQTAGLTWPEIRARFEATNPSLLAGLIGLDESRAAEITAYLRPNPTLTATGDQIGHNDNGKPFDDFLLTTSVSYLHERERKRELRRDSAQKATAIALSNQADLDRNLTFTLRGAFVQVLQAKTVLALARDNLTFFDQVLSVSRDRFQAGDIAQIDLDRLELQRVQYESDLQTADVNVRTSKIQLLMLLNDRTPVDEFDVTGPFDYAELTRPLDGLRQIALDLRPDLRAAIQAIDKAKSDHQLAIANGSTDPTFNVDAGLPGLSQVAQSYAPPLYEFVGVGISVPLRIFDKNQGEKLRTQLDIGRNERLTDVARAQVFRDVDSAYATIESTITLLRPYRTSYLTRATNVRDTVTFSYERGGASLLDFLQAQQDYRSVQLGYVNLVGTYLTAASQLNLAVGQEVIQ
jgi:cobalt-zinc-cadmium efflux system outer membrane protein